jgi:cardiolipin synthase (CMP-forming)
VSPLTRKQIPNLVTGARLLSIPVLWGFAMADRPLVVGIGLLFAWFSDALDGTLARILDARSRWGSQFDSISDTLMFLSAVAWVALLRPEFLREYAPFLGAWLAVGALAYGVAWIRFRRLPDVHLLSAKGANLVGFLFAAYLIAFGDVASWTALAVIGICLIAALETLAVVATFPEVDDRILTVFQRPTGPRRT